MKKYQYSPETRSVLESLQQPLAVFQYIDGQVVTLVVSDGFCRLFGYADRRQAMSGMDHDMFGYTHPDDRAQLSESTRRFAEKDEPFDVVFMDPPYGHSLERRVLEALKGGSVIGTDTLIIIEASKDTAFSYLEELGYRILRDKSYGSNRHVFVKAVTE